MYHRPSLQFLLPGAPNVVYSACLMQKAEEMFDRGKAPYPAERTMLVCGMLEQCLESKITDHQRLETPELILSYQPPATPQFVGAPTKPSSAAQPV